MLHQTHAFGSIGYTTLDAADLVLVALATLAPHHRHAVEGIGNDETTALVQFPEGVRLSATVTDMIAHPFC
jgi:hypothetical protein